MQIQKQVRENQLIKQEYQENIRLREEEIKLLVSVLEDVRVKYLELAQKVKDK